MNRPATALSSLLVVIAGATPALAQEEGRRGEPTGAPLLPRTSYGFIEAAGNFGFSFGEQDYVPNGAPGKSKHPLTSGFGFNATAGVAIARGLDIIVDYSYASADSREGDVVGVLDEVEGSITYQTITAGVRGSYSTSFGNLYGELGAGIVLPFETELKFVYAAPMSELGISGTGTRTDNYNIGPGAHAEFGYQLPILGVAYLGAGVRVQSFESNNDGESTEFDNFVIDFEAPEPVTMEVNHGTESAAMPQAFSVQDVRLHINLGTRF